MLFYRLDKSVVKNELVIGEAMAVDPDCEGCRLDDEGARTNPTGRSGKRGLGEGLTGAGSGRLR